MPLQKIEAFDPHYHEAFQGSDIKGMDVYTQGTNEKVGTVNDILVDEQGQFRYLVLDLGGWIFGKKVLLPIGRSQIDQQAGRVHAVGLTKAQAEALPEFNDRAMPDSDHEEQVRGVFRPPAAGAAMTGTMPAQPSKATDAHQQDSSLYDLNDRDHQTIKLYQERLLASKTRRKTGEVAVGKHVETETARVSVPIEKERIVIERVTPSGAGEAVAPGTYDFAEGEVARMEVYEETADIHKEAFVREEVRVNKVVEQETVQAQDTIRREELDIDAGGQTVEDRTGKLPNDRV